MANEASITASKTVENQITIWVIKGYTKPFTQTLLQAGAVWNAPKIRWEFHGDSLPAAIRDAIAGVKQLDPSTVSPVSEKPAKPKKEKPPKPETKSTVTCTCGWKLKDVTSVAVQALGEHRATCEKAKWEDQLRAQEAKAREAVAAESPGAIEEIARAAEIGHQRPCPDQEEFAIGDTVETTMVKGNTYTGVVEIIQPVTVSPNPCGRIKSRIGYRLENGDLKFNYNTNLRVVTKGREIKVGDWVQHKSKAYSHIQGRVEKIVPFPGGIGVEPYDQYYLDTGRPGEIRCRREELVLIDEPVKPVEEKPAFPPKPTVSPVREQYLRIKQEAPDALLFFQLGDFFEMFDEDAEIIARELDLVLTSRPINKTERVPMAGIPVHAIESYVKKLLAKGFTVAICEQMSEPNGRLVERKITSIRKPLRPYQAYEEDAPDYEWGSVPRQVHEAKARYRKDDFIANWQYVFNTGTDDYGLVKQVTDKGVMVIPDSAHHETRLWPFEWVIPITPVIEEDEPQLPDPKPIRWLSASEIKPYKRGGFVYAVEDIHESGKVIVPKGTRGKIFSRGPSALNVNWDGYPHGMLCIYDMVSLEPVEVSLPAEQSERIVQAVESIASVIAEARQQPTHEICSNCRKAAMYVVWRDGKPYCEECITQPEKPEEICVRCGRSPVSAWVYGAAYCDSCLQPAKDWNALEGLVVTDGNDNPVTPQALLVKAEFARLLNKVEIAPQKQIEIDVRPGKLRLYVDGGDDPIGSINAVSSQYFSCRTSLFALKNAIETFTDTIKLTMRERVLNVDSQNTNGVHNLWARPV